MSRRRADGFTQQQSLGVEAQRLLQVVESVVEDNRSFHHGMEPDAFLAQLGGWTDYRLPAEPTTIAAAPPATHTDILSLTVPDMVRSLASGELSSVAITSAYLDHAHSRNPEINGYIRIESDSALARAAQADVARRHGKEVHPLCGIPIAIKDIFHRRGIPVSAGSSAYIMDSGLDATVVQRLRQAGMPVLGTLNLDEFAAGGTGTNEHFGRCLNPIHRHFLSGGSSSGSAAVIGAHMAPLSLGSDAGGSIRLPAGWCGVTGLKPTYGQVSRHGVVPRTWSMDCIGPLAHDAVSCALLLELIAGEDDQDPATLPGKQLFTPVPDVPDRSLRIGVDGRVSDTVGREQGVALSRVGALFRDWGLGIVETMLPDLEPLNQLHQVVVKCEAAAIWLHDCHLMKTRCQKPSGTGCRAGLEIPAVAYLSALRLRRPCCKPFWIRPLETRTSFCCLCARTMSRQVIILTSPGCLPTPPALPDS